jgi:peptidyl-prolyl cis-trans isomerase-like 3
LGNIKIELFCESCPKTCENFLALCASEYYTGNLFHRNIKGFIVQTGDPTGTGKGGTSIWDKKFEDEYKEQLKVICWCHFKLYNCMLSYFVSTPQEE